MTLCLVVLLGLGIKRSQQYGYLFYFAGIGNYLPFTVIKKRMRVHGLGSNQGHCTVGSINRNILSNTYCNHADNEITSIDHM